MITYNLSLERQNLIGADKFSVAADSNETICFRFHFDRSWRVFETIAAVFKSSRGKYYVLDIRGSCVTVPWEVLRDTSGFELAVVAYENEIVLTSKKVRISVSASLLPEFCRQLSPTETIFDRFKTEARSEAHEDYEDEIRALKHEHYNEVAGLNSQIRAEQNNTEAVRAEKEAEIAQLNYQASCTLASHNAQVAELRAQLAELQEKAHNWDLVDNAIQIKDSLSQPLWTGGSEPFELPMMNILSASSFNYANISLYLTKIGFNVSGITNLNELFRNKTRLQEATLVNTDSVTNITNAFDGCTALKKADIGNPKVCSTWNYAFNNCSSVEEIKLGNPERISSFNLTFSNCYSLKKIDGTLNAMLCMSFTNAFNNCSNLEEIRFTESSIRTIVNFGTCVSLSKESIFNIANGLNSEYPATVTFSNHALTSNLTADELDELTALVTTEKGWTLSKV